MNGLTNNKLSMKQIHCHTPHPSHRRDMGFVRYFDIGASPHMQWEFDRESKSWRIEYLPKHYQPHGRVFWDSFRNGTIRRTSGKGINAKYVAESVNANNT